MFDRFTEDARKAMAHARRAAQRWNHEFVAPEHILAGVLAVEGSTACGILTQLGVEPKRVSEEIEKGIKPGPRMVTAGFVPFTPEAKAVLEQSMLAANEFDHPQIGTEHILLGILRRPGTMACQVLAELGVNAEQVGLRVAEIEPAEDRELPAPPPAEPPPSRWVLDLARKEAHRRGHGFVGPGDLLMGILLEDGPAAKLLKDLGVTLERIEPVMAKLVGDDLEAVGAHDLKPLPLARRSMARAGSEARLLGRARTEPEHVLLGLLGEPDGAASRFLREAGLDLEEVRRRALRTRTPDEESEGTAP